jgi:hypothetical protein
LAKLCRAAILKHGSHSWELCKHNSSVVTDKVAARFGARLDLRVGDDVAMALNLAIDRGATVSMAMAVLFGQRPLCTTRAERVGRHGCLRQSLFHCPLERSFEHCGEAGCVGAGVLIEYDVDEVQPRTPQADSAAAVDCAGAHNFLMRNNLQIQRAVAAPTLASEERGPFDS